MPSFHRLELFSSVALRLRRERPWARSLATVPAAPGPTAIGNDVTARRDRSIPSDGAVISEQAIHCRTICSAVFQASLSSFFASVRANVFTWVETYPSDL